MQTEALGRYDRQIGAHRDCRRRRGPSKQRARRRLRQTLVCSSQSPDARCRGMPRPEPVRTRLRQRQRKRSCELANFHCDGRGDSPRDKHATDRLMSSPGRGSFLRPYHHKGARRVTHHGFGHATEKRPLPSAATMTADDEEVRRPLLSSLDNLVGRPADLKEFQDG
jgi:hypothetical protein